MNYSQRSQRRAYLSFIKLDLVLIPVVHVAYILEPPEALEFFAVVLLYLQRNRDKRTHQEGFNAYPKKSILVLVV
jgi:hypothetical protein